MTRRTRIRNLQEFLDTYVYYGGCSYERTDGSSGRAIWDSWIDETNNDAVRDLFNLHEYARHQDMDHMLLRTQLQQNKGRIPLRYLIPTAKIITDMHCGDVEGVFMPVDTVIQYPWYHMLSKHHDVAANYLLEISQRMKPQRIALIDKRHIDTEKDAIRDTKVAEKVWLMHGKYDDYRRALNAYLFYESCLAFLPQGKRTNAYLEKFRDIRGQMPLLFSEALYTNKNNMRFVDILRNFDYHMSTDFNAYARDVGNWEHYMYRRMVDGQSLQEIITDCKLENRPPIVRRWRKA